MPTSPPARNTRNHGQRGSGQNRTQSSNSIAPDSQTLLTIQPQDVTSVVFVRDLPFFSQNDDLRRFIQVSLGCPTNAVRDVQVRYSQKDWKTMQVAVVVFQDEVTALQAIDTMNGMRFEGRDIRVQRYDPANAQVESSQNGAVYVSFRGENRELPLITEEIVRKTFEAKFGPLRDVCIRYHRREDDGMQIGQAFLTFEDEYTNVHVIKHMGRTCLGELRVDCRPSSNAGGGGGSHTESAIVGDTLSPSVIERSNESSDTDDVMVDIRQRLGDTVGTRSPIGSDTTPSQHVRGPTQTNQQQLRRHDPRSRSGPRLRPALQSSQGLRGLEGHGGVSAESRQSGQHDAWDLSSLRNDSNNTSTGTAALLYPTPGVFYPPDPSSTMQMQIPRAYSMSPIPYPMYGPSGFSSPRMGPQTVTFVHLSPSVDPRTLSGGSHAPYVSPSGHPVSPDYGWPAPSYGHPALGPSWSPSAYRPEVHAPQLTLPQPHNPVMSMPYQMQGPAHPFQMHMQHQQHQQHQQRQSPQQQHQSQLSQSTVDMPRPSPL